VGNPPAQDVLVGVDTASSDLWVNANCSGVERMRDPAALCAKSSSYAPSRDAVAPATLGTVRKLAYGPSGFEGTATVQYYADDVRIGGKAPLFPALSSAAGG
jgi:hypothetical protein